MQQETEAGEKVQLDEIMKELEDEAADDQEVVTDGSVVVEEISSLEGSDVQDKST